MNKTISPEQAMKLLLKQTAELSVKETESIPLVHASGRSVRNQIRAVMNQPPFSRSALDGYALRSADTAGASPKTPVRLPVVQTLYAGAPAQYPLPPKQAVRIMTGAPLPEGADCILPQELTDCGKEQVEIYRELSVGSNVCRQGEDVPLGMVLLEPGTLLTPVHIGMLAGQGFREIEVFRQLKIGLLSTGYELLRPGQIWQPGKIFDCNAAQIQARLCQFGFLTVQDQSPNTISGTAQMIHTMLQNCDALVTTGGISVGEEDFLPQSLAQIGADILFRGIRQKPGGGMLAACYNRKLILCLSGNPFAAAATLEQYALPALLRLGGRQETLCIPKRARLHLKSHFDKTSSQHRFLRGIAQGAEVILPGKTEDHASGSLRTMIGCNCLVCLPAGTGPLVPDTEVEVMYFVQP